jgi:hypothetical protein
MSARAHHIKVTLSDQELARLDEIRGEEERASTCAGCCRSLPAARSPPAARRYENFFWTWGCADYATFKVSGRSPKF